MKIKNRSRICLIISAAIIVVALFLTIIGHGINMGIDFAGGQSVVYKLTENTAVNKAEVEKVLSAMNIGSYTVTVQGNSSNEVNLRLRDVAEENIESVKKVVALAKEKGIPVIAYDRLIMHTDAVSYYASFENNSVGEFQARYVEEIRTLAYFLVGRKAHRDARVAAVFADYPL